jgi:hypothetical protein
MKKPCKYCKSIEHVIDFCPEILCKICNERGHPHWKCKAVEKDKIVDIKNIDIDDKNIIPPVQMKSVDCSGLKNINDYINIVNIPWGELKF